MHTYFSMSTAASGTSPRLLLGAAVITAVALILTRFARTAVLASAEAARLSGYAEGRRAEQRAHLRTMHDTVLQTLEAIVARAETHPDGAGEALQDVARYARRQALELRHLLAADGSELVQSGVGVILERLVEEASEKGLVVELNAIDLEHLVLPSEVAPAVLGAVREGLSNVRKHAGVSRAVVLARTTPDSLVVTIRDHGCGFDMAYTPVGFGLRGSIIERMAEIGGSVEVESTLGTGTRVRLTVPTQPVTHRSPKTLLEVR